MKFDNIPQKSIKKIVWILYFGLIVFIFTANPVFAAGKGWVKSDGKYRYYYSEKKYYKNSVRKIKGYYYYFNKKGFGRTGWVKYNNKTYYFDLKSRKAKTGFCRIDDKLFYFNNKGVLCTGIITIGNDRFLADKKGRIYRKRLLGINKKYYYADDTGRFAGGFVNYENNTYYFDPKSREAKTGFCLIDDKLFYFNNKGILCTGIITIGNNRYFADSKGRIYQKRLFENNNNYYYADDTGKLVRGFVNYRNKMYFLNADDTLAKGVFSVNKYMYGADDQGVIYQDAGFENQGFFYYADHKGRLKTNCIYENAYYDSLGHRHSDLYNYSDLSDDAEAADSGEMQSISTMLDSMDLSRCTKLMIVAHPDDETIWGGAHLSDHGYFILCLTNRSNTVRRNEFEKVLQMSGNSGLILDYPDLINGQKSDWEGYKEKISRDIDVVLNYKPWGLVVTHNPAGEYGHQHHIYTSAIVTRRFYLNRWDDNLFYFGTYYRPCELQKVCDDLVRVPEKNLSQKEELLTIYSLRKSVARFWHMNPYEEWTRASSW